MSLHEHLQRGRGQKAGLGTHACTLPTMWLRRKYCMPLYSPTSFAWLLSPLVKIHCSVELRLQDESRQLSHRGSGVAQSERNALVVRFDHAMHDRDGRAGDLVDGDVAVLERRVARHSKEEEVATLDCRFHALAAGRSDRSAMRMRGSKSARADLSTTTTGLSVLQATESPFHIIKAVEMTMAKLSACVRT